MDWLLLDVGARNSEVDLRSLEYTVETVGAKKLIAVLTLDGYVDSATSLNMDEAIDSVLQQQIYHVVVDLTKVGYISSAGWGVFISKIKDIRENHGGLKIAGMRPDVRDVFDLLGFGHIIEAHESVDDATAAFELEIARPVRSTEFSGGSGS
jgi:anti-sigma B factor antagonist